MPIKKVQSRSKNSHHGNFIKTVCFGVKIYRDKNLDAMVQEMGFELNVNKTQHFKEQTNATRECGDQNVKLHKKL